MTPLLFLHRHGRHLLSIVMIGAVAFIAGAESSNEPVSTNGAAVHALSFKEISRHWSRVPLDQLLVKAGEGNAEAQSYLAWCYAGGHGVTQSQTEAAAWYRKAAEQGLAEAEAQLGWICANGWGVTADRQTAMDWIRKATDQGHVVAEFLLGQMYENPEIRGGGLIEGNYQIAAEWFEKAAKDGNVHAQFALAMLHHYGKLGSDQRSNAVPLIFAAAKQGHPEAKELVKELHRYYPYHPLVRGTPEMQLEAAERGEIRAQFDLASRYRNADGVAKNPAEAFRLMKMAAENPTNYSLVSGARYQLGLMYERGEGVAKNQTEANRLILIAAQGNWPVPAALDRAAKMYENGMGAEQDYGQAASIYLQRVEQGYPFAVERLTQLMARASAAHQGVGSNVLCAVGNFYREGKHVAQDLAKAAELFSSAAEQGSAEAKYRVGQMWAEGNSGTPDPVEAAKWYRKAAVAGWAEAQFQLGLCLANGKGVSADRVEAWRWLDAAAEQEFPEADTEREKLEFKMTPEQFAARKGPPGLK